MAPPYCFDCNQEMNCLKTGFIFRPSTAYPNFAVNTDLFYCRKCHSFATNRMTDKMISNHCHYEEGKFTQEFIRSRLDCYKDLTPADFETPRKVRN